MGTWIRRLGALVKALVGQLTTLAAGLTLLYTLVYFLLNAHFTTAIFDELVNSMFRGRISWTQLRWGPEPWRLTAIEPTITGPEGEVVIHAEALHARRVDLIDLLSLHITVDDILIDRPTVRLRQRVHPTALDAWGDPETPFNIAEVFWSPVLMPEGGEPTSSLPLSFTNARVRGARFELDMEVIFIEVEGFEAEGVYFTLDPIDVERTMGIGLRSGSVRRGSVTISLVEGLRGRDVRGPEQGLSWPIERLKLRDYWWREFRFGAQRLTALVRGDPVEVRRYRLDLTTPMPDMSCTAKLKVADIGPHLEALGLSGLRGAAEARAEIHGEVDDLNGRVRAEVVDLDVFGIPLARAKLVAEKHQSGEVDIERLEAVAAEGLIQGRGGFHLLHGDGHLDLEIADLDPARLPIGVDPPEILVDILEGRLRGRVLARARDLYEDHREVSAAIHAILARRGGPFYGLGRAPHLDVAASLQGTQLQVTQLDLKGGAAWANLRADLALDGLTIDAKGSVGLSSLSAAYPPLGGSASARVKVTGPVADPKVEARVRGRRLRYARYPGVALDAQASYHKGYGRVSWARIGALGGHLKLKGGRINLNRRSLPIRAQIDAEDLTLTGLIPHLKGKIDAATLELRGPATAPTIEVEALELSEPGWDRIRFRDLSLSGAFSQNRALRIDALRVGPPIGKGVPKPKTNAPLLRLHGGVDLVEEAFDVQLRLSPFDLATLDAWFGPLKLEGEVEASVAARGPLLSPRGSGGVQVRGLKREDVTLGDAHLDLQTRGGVLTVVGDLFETFKLKARLPVDPSSEALAQARLEFEELHVEDFYRLPKALKREEPKRRGDKPKGLKTRFDGAAEARLHIGSGTLKYANLKLERLEVAYDELEIEGAPPIEIGLEDQLLNVERLQLKIGEDIFSLEGWLNLAEQTADARLEGRLDLVAVAPFLKGVFTDFGGLLGLDLRLSGSLTAPTILGHIALERLEATPRSAVVGRELRLMRPVELQILPPEGPALPPEDGQLTQLMSLSMQPTKRDGSPNQFRLQRDDSTVDVTQLEASFEGFLPTWLLVEAESEEVHLSIPKVLRADAALSPIRFEMWRHQLKRGLTEDRMRVGGDVRLLRGEFLQDIVGTSELNQSFRDSLRGTTRTTSVNVFEAIPALRLLTLDLRVRGQNEFFIRNQIAVLDLNLEVRTDLRVQGYIYEPPVDAPDEELDLVGRVEILPDSTITYARRPFEVLDGRVRFEGKEGEFIRAELEASHTFRLRTDEGSSSSVFDNAGGGEARLEEVVLKAQMSMSSRLSRPDIDLSLISSSGASKIEVATLVLTGRYPSDLSGAASAQPATEVLLGPLIGLIERPLEETLDLELDIAPVSTGSLFISADKLLSRRLRLYTRTPVGDEDSATPQIFGLEYQLNNATFGELTNESVSEANTTSGRLKLRILFD